MPRRTIWRTRDWDARLIVVWLWDGRCAHCDVPLVRVDGMPCGDLHLDHATPQSLGGTHQLSNYLASCSVCNTRRQDDQLSSPRVLKNLSVARALVESEDFPDLQETLLASTEDWLYRSLHLTGYRCAIHRWHLADSIAQRSCYERALGANYQHLGVEWWSRFGLESVHVWWSVTEYLANLGVRATPPLLRSLRLNLPRYCRSSDEWGTVLPRVLDCAPGNPAPSHLAEISLPVSATFRTNAERSVRMTRVRREIEVWRSEGIDVPQSMMKLWISRHWPGDLIGAYATSVNRISAEGPKRHVARMADLQNWEAARGYLIQLESGAS